MSQQMSKQLSSELALLALLQLISLPEQALIHLFMRKRPLLAVLSEARYLSSESLIRQSTMMLISSGSAVLISISLRA